MTKWVFQFVRQWFIWQTIVYGSLTIFLSTSTSLADETRIELTISSIVLEGDRQIKVSLPESYHLSNKSYPVFYVLDGDFLFDPAVVISKIKASRDLMPEVIIVGISTPNSEERLSMSLPTRREENGQLSFENGSPANFLRFMEEELIPSVQSKYRTADYKGLIGMSPTVGPVFHGYFEGADTFQAWVGIAANVQMYGADNLAITTKIIESEKNLKGTRNWLYLSRGEIDVNRNEGLLNAIQTLQETYTHNDSRVRMDIIKGGEHYASSIISLDNAFSFFFPPDVWTPDYLSIRSENDPVDVLKKFYSNLSQQYGFDTYPVNDGYWMGFSLAGTGRYLKRNNRIEEAKELLKWGLEFSPKSEALNEPLNELENSNQ